MVLFTLINRGCFPAEDQRREESRCLCHLQHYQVKNMFLFVGLFCTGQINFPFMFYIFYDHVLFSNCSLVMPEFFDINALNLSLTLCSSETSPLCSTATYSRVLPCAFTAWPISGKLLMDRSPTERDPITSGGFTRAGCLTQGQAWWVFAHFLHSEATTEWIRHVFSQSSVQSPACTTKYFCADDAQLRILHLRS